MDGPTVLTFFTVARQWPCFLFKPPELQILASIPSRGSVLALHVKILGLEQILHAWWRLMSQEEPWSGRLNVILQPRALPRASGTAFQSFVAHIMPPSPVPCHHINMLAQSYYEYCRWMNMFEGTKEIVETMASESYCNFWFTRILPYFPFVKGVTSQLFSLNWGFTPWKSYILWMHII